MAEITHDRLPKIEPGAENPGALRFLRSMVSNPISVTPGSAYREPVVVLSVAGSKIVFVTDPEILEEVLVKRPDDFPKSAIHDRVLRPVFGDSLLTAHGQEWRWKRRLSAPPCTTASRGRRSRTRARRRSATALRRSAGPR